MTEELIISKIYTTVVDTTIVSETHQIAFLRSPSQIFHLINLSDGQKRDISFRLFHHSSIRLWKELVFSIFLPNISVPYRIQSVSWGKFCWFFFSETESFVYHFIRFNYWKDSDGNHRLTTWIFVERIFNQLYKYRLKLLAQIEHVEFFLFNRINVTITYVS